MRTDDLIAALTTDLTPTSATRLRRRVLLGLVPAVILALVGVWLTLGFRSDLATAMLGPVFWAKAAYTVAAAGAGFWLLERVGRPGAKVHGPLILLGLIASAAVLTGSMTLATMPETERMAAVMGGSARVCPINLAGLSLLAAPFVAFAARGFAPLRPGLAGAASGLLTGGVAATAYGLHCPEHTAAFVAVWYTLGMMIPVAVGAVVGRVFWRW